jgi:hypothetical protein
MVTNDCLIPGATILVVANTGQTLDDLKVDDLSLTAKKAAGRGKTMLFMDQSKRDSCVLDSFIEVCTECHFFFWRNKAHVKVGVSFEISGLSVLAYAPW